MTLDERLMTADLTRPAPRRVRPLLLGELAVVAVLLVVYDHVRALAHVHRAAAVHHGSAILDLEHALHLNLEPAVNHWLSGQGVLGRLSVDYYQYLHVGVAMGLLIACYVLRPHVYRPARNALLFVNAVGLAVYVAYPVAPPRLLPGTTFLDMVARAGFGTAHGGPIPIDQYGAMPSLHLAWAMWAALIGFVLTEVVWIRCLLLLHPVLTTFVVVGTGNHYVLDAVMGVALACAAVACVFVPRALTNQQKGPLRWFPTVSLRRREPRELPTP